MMSKIYQKRLKNGVTPDHGLGRLTLMLLLVLFSVLGSTNLYAQDPPQYGTPFAGVPNRMDANIYQLNLREYSTTRNIAGARAKLQRIKDLGINVVYLMPVFPIGANQTSPYCNSDYKSVAPDLGTLADLRGLVQDCHNLGMAVILDFIANQTSFDHPWTTSNPSWYFRDGNGVIQSPCPSPGFCFTDVAALDLNQSGAAAAMIDAMRYWIFAANVDGYRFDWADQAPQAFWTNAVSNLRGITSHNLLLLAEGSNEGSTSGCTSCGNNQPGAHYAQGFDYIFGTNFYWNVMKKVWNAGEPATNLDGVTTGEYTGASSTQLVARFLSNHDDYNADGSPFQFLAGGRNAAMSTFVVATYHRGVPFIYNGIEVGNTNPLPYPWNSGNINWTQDLTVYTEMQKILNFRNASMAIKRGQPTSYTTSANNNVIAFTKINGSEKVAVMVNVRNSTQTFTIPAGMAGSYVNPLNNNASVTLTSGASITLTPYQYLVVTNASVPVVPVTGVSVSPTSASIKVGLTQQLTASVAPSNATNQNVTWSSSNNGVATVSATGLVTAIATGTATITVTTQDGNRTATCAVTVTPPTTFTVYFSKPAAWGTDIRIYYWDAQPTGVLANATWPGPAMTLGADGWYSYTFTNVTTTNLIFNANSDVNKTADLTRGSTGWYLGTTWYNSKPTVPNSLTVSPTSLSVGSGSGSSAIAVTSNVSWTVSDNQSWISTSATSGSNNGSFNVTVTANTGAARSGTVTVTGGSITQTISVAQAAAPGAVALPGTIQAESWTSMSGVQTETTSDAGGGLNVGWIDAGDWMDYSVNVATAGTYTVSFRMASGGTGGTLQLRNSGGTTLCSATVGGTGGWQNWSTITATATLTAGTQTLRLHASTGGYNVNWVQFTTGGSTQYYALQNRWTNAYLNDNGANVGYGATVANNNYKWEKVATDGGFFYLKNLGTGQYMHIENQTGAVQCTAITLGWWSAQWSQETAEGAWVRFRNRWQTGNMIHVENQNGSAQYAGAQNGWFSAQWQLVPVSGSRFGAGTSELLDDEKVSIYPNPFKSSLTLDLPEFEQSEISLNIFDTSGRLVLARKLELVGSKSLELNLDELHSGVYFLNVQTPVGVQSFKVIKE